MEGVMKTYTKKQTNVKGQYARQKVLVGMTRLPGLLRGFVGPILAATLILAVLAGCGIWDRVGITNPTETTPPTVISTDPENNATDVALNKIITATFSEAMDPSTVTTTTFTLKQGETPVSGAVTYAGTVGTFTPAADLEANTTYTATITTGVRDLAGNAMTNNYECAFT